MIIKNRAEREKDILAIGDYCGELLQSFSDHGVRKHYDRDQVRRFVIDMNNMHEELTQYIEFFVQIRKKIRSGKFQRLLSAFKHISQ